MDHENPESFYQNHVACADLKGTTTGIFSKARSNAQGLGPIKNRIVDSKLACKFDRNAKPYCKDPKKASFLNVMKLVHEGRDKSLRSFEKALDRNVSRQNQRNQAVCQRLSEALEKEKR